MTVTTVNHALTGDIALDVPSDDRCWKFYILFACGCPVTSRGFGHISNLVIRVKQDNHCGPCQLRRCTQASATHVLRQNCVHCELADARFAGAYV
ncbi:hypothetical protein F4802DRAFT_563181 [Xylaria palmicola]|nr:hypothetical protein F4802DRAFT_563181 [Xylaria palmicola]